MSTQLNRRGFLRRSTLTTSAAVLGFICVGMFDFQLSEDVLLAKDAFGQAKMRERPWCA